MSNRHGSTVRRRSGLWPRQTLALRRTGYYQRGGTFEWTQHVSTGIGIRVLRNRKPRGRLTNVARWPFGRTRITPRETMRRHRPQRWHCVCCGYMSGVAAARCGDVCEMCVSARNIWAGTPDADLCPTCQCEMLIGPGGGLFCDVCGVGDFRGSEEGGDMEDGKMVYLGGVRARGYDANNMALLNAMKSLIDAHRRHLDMISSLYLESATDVETRYYLDAMLSEEGMLKGLEMAAAIVDMFVLPG
jgi:hypothetical protein